MDFKLVSEYKPTGDQPKAIESLVKGVEMGLDDQVLLGVTGSGKTFTMANVIAKLNRPTLVLAHNKTLAAQLCSEFREFFPENAVEYFISYYDYYQPEAYIAHTDTYIEKDSAINDEIERLRHSATSALSERRDVIVVSSVSCIYGLGDPIDYKNMVISLRTGQTRERDELIRRLTDIRYERNDMNFTRNTFRVRGDTLKFTPPTGQEGPSASSFSGTKSTAFPRSTPSRAFPNASYSMWPSTRHHTMSRPKKKWRARCTTLKKRCGSRSSSLNRTTSYSRPSASVSGRSMTSRCYLKSASAPASKTTPASSQEERPAHRRQRSLTTSRTIFCSSSTSHVTLPQVRAMYNGDHSRKQSLVDYGFRLPSAYDNRPLKFDEFEAKIHQAIFVSATPGDYEREHAANIAEQLIRPTGLLDPEVFIRPIEGQIDDLIGEINATTAKGERTLVTTLTKKMAEDLTKYLTENGIRVRYMHSDIGAMERMEIIRDLRMAKFDVLIGINLLREGLDLPEVSLIAILDADKEGFLRSETSLIQTIGRAARNAEGRVLLYADKITPAMRAAMDETARRRQIQDAYNKEHGIVPKTIVKSVRDLIEISATPTPRAQGAKAA